MTEVDEAVQKILDRVLPDYVKVSVYVPDGVLAPQWMDSDDRFVRLATTRHIRGAWLRKPYMLEENIDDFEDEVISACKTLAQLAEEPIDD